MGLAPMILSTIGFAYIAIPANVQETVRGFIPLSFRESMLTHLTSEDWLITLLVSTIILAIWGSLGSHITVSLIKKQHKEVKESCEMLKQDRDSKSINCYRLFSNYLYGYYDRFDLTAQERVSLYKLDMDQFLCIGRYSDNEMYNSKPSRLYSKDEGCISKAWELGKIQDANLPDPESKLDEWVKYNIDKYNFSDDVLRNIKMKSRSLYCFRLKNIQNEIIAVIVFESVSPDGLKFGKLDRFFNDYEKKNITHLIESLKKHIPSLEMARAEGF